MTDDPSDVRGSAPAFNTTQLLREIYSDVKILRPQVASLVEADLPRRVRQLETSVASLIEQAKAERSLDEERELRYQQRYEAQTLGLATALTAQKEAVAAALTALDKQSQLEGGFVDRRLAKTEPYGDTLSRMAGSSVAVQQGWKYVLAVGSVLIGLAGVIVAIAQMSN